MSACDNNNSLWLLQVTPQTIGQYVKILSNGKHKLGTPLVSRIHDYDPSTKMSQIWYVDDGSKSIHKLDVNLYDLKYGTDFVYLKNYEKFPLPKPPFLKLRKTKQCDQNNRQDFYFYNKIFNIDYDWIPDPLFMKFHQKVKALCLYDKEFYCGTIDGYDHHSRRIHINYGEMKEWIWPIKNKNIKIYNGELEDYISDSKIEKPIEQFPEFNLNIYLNHNLNFKSNLSRMKQLGDDRLQSQIALEESVISKFRASSVMNAFSTPGKTKVIENNNADNSNKKKKHERIVKHFHYILVCHFAQGY